jgi:hypothetical protein
MFEEYLKNSYDFLVKARKASDLSNEREARCYYRASIFYGAGAMEAFVNYIADSFYQAGNLTPLETAFLSDKILTFDKGKLVERVEFHKLDSKLRVLLHKFVNDFDLSCESWYHLMKFKDFRDTLVHPRKIDDDTEIVEYDQKVSDGLKSIIYVMNCISKGIFNKPMRRQLLDLIPE